MYHKSYKIIPFRVLYNKLLLNKKCMSKQKLRTCLYLDDMRTPTQTIPGYKPWEVVKNYDEFSKWIIKNGIPDLISFDHDLAEEHMNDYNSQFIQQGYQIPEYHIYKEKTGLDCAKFLVEYSQRMNTPIKACCVHSHNPVGARNIQSYINGYHRHTDQPETCYLDKNIPFEIKNN